MCVCACECECECVAVSAAGFCHLSRLTGPFAADFFHFRSVFCSREADFCHFISRHKITPGAKERRLECTTKLLNKLKHKDAGKVIIIFTDEKYFTLAQYLNHQNDKLM